MSYAARAVARAAAAPFAGPRAYRIAVRLLPVVVAAAMLGGASWLSLYSATRSSADTVTALSVLPIRTLASTGRTFDVVVTGIAAGDRFQLRITATGYSSVLAVDATEGWHQVVNVPGNGRVGLDLYRVGATVPYRSVSLGESTAFDGVSDATGPLE